jgi:MoaA/NifB/PqqE/SkfB family radical SAM enzyme
MCDIWKTQEQKTFGLCELTPQLDSIRRLGVRWVVFTGGEPLMNAELPSVCAVLRKEGIRLTLLSTGLLLKKCARDVAEYFDDVIVSLDGPPEIHDNIRRVRGAFGLLEEASVQSEKSRTSKLRPVHCSKPIIVILCATARA